LIKSSARVLVGSAPRGFAPDWVTYSDAHGFADDANSGPFGSYDAVRVYLWAAMLPHAEPRRQELARSAAELTDLVNRLGRMPERIQVHTAEVSTTDGPAGFLAVAAAAAHAVGNTYLATELLERLERTRHQGLYGEPATYYDQNLALFALGFIEKRYELAADGRLLLAWNAGACRSH
jgi:endoglucanase